MIAHGSLYNDKTNRDLPFDMFSILWGGQELVYERLAEPSILKKIND